MSKITIDEQKYEVTEDLGFSHSCGCKAKFVMTESGERIAVYQSGKWRFRTPEEKIQARSNYAGQ